MNGAKLAISFLLDERNMVLDKDLEKSSTFFDFFFKKVLTYASDSCNIIQVADRHGNETAKQALNGRPLMSSEKKLRKNFKKFLTS